MPLLDALGGLVAWLQAARVPGVIIGGVAVSLLGRPRVTRDVDAVVLLEERGWSQFLSLGTRFGFKPRGPDTIKFARKSRVLLVRHEASRIDVDVVFGALPFERKLVEGARWVVVEGVRLPLPRPEDLIIMKAVAHRPRDLADIESLLDAHPKLDLQRIRRWVRQFSNALAMPDIMSDLENILNRYHGKRKKKL